MLALPQSKLNGLYKPYQYLVVFCSILDLINILLLQKSDLLERRPPIFPPFLLSSKKDCKSYLHPPRSSPTNLSLPLRLLGPQDVQPEELWEEAIANGYKPRAHRAKDCKKKSTTYVD